jgi:Contractile injection system tube protein
MNVFQRRPTKLTLSAYSDREMTHLSGSLSVMYNPDSVSLDYRTDYVPNRPINTSRQSNRYVQTYPAGLTLELLFDAKMPGNRLPIDEQLTHLRSLCYSVNPADSEPRYIQVKWGQMRWGGRRYFSGRISSLSERYILFKRDATPLRAIVMLVLTADGSLTLQEAQEQLIAPATAVVNVPDATSLPQIASGAGAMLSGDTDYLAVAAENDLDSLDAIQAGQTLQISTESEA